MSTNPVSFRVAFESQIAKLPPEHQRVIRTQMNAITDLQGAIPALKSQIEALKANPTGSTTGTTSSSVPSNITENITTINNTVSGGPVNNQMGNATYITQQSDNAALIILSDAAAIAVTLNNSVTIPWFTSLSNAGTSIATITPAQGTVNGNANLTLPAGSWSTIYFDGLNFWAESPGTTAGGVTSIIAGSNVTISPPSGTGAVTVNASGGSGGTITGVTSGTGLTGGGTSGNVTVSLDTPVSVTDGGNGTSTPGLVAGTNVTITGTWPNQTIASSGGGGYSLGGTLSATNVTLGPGAGTGATFLGVTGLDGNHTIAITTGSSPAALSFIFTVNFTTPRGNLTFPVVSLNAGIYSSLSQVVHPENSGSPSLYSLESGTTPLNATTTYIWNVSCP